MIFFLLQLLVIVHMACYVHSNNRPPPIPNKVKLYQSKARSVSSKSTFRENQLTTKGTDASALAALVVPRLSSKASPTFELFVRTQASPWVRFKDVLGSDELIQTSISQVLEGRMNSSTQTWHNLTRICNPKVEFLQNLSEK